MTRQPNVVWITIESTRHDHTTLDGYERDTTPNLRRIAEASAGRSFDECITHGVWTLPSSASILTGTYPSRHGAGMGSEAIPDDLPTVAERLQEVGYTTACLSPNSHLSSATGLARGFDRFSWISSSNLLEAVGVRTLLKYAANVRAHGGGFTLDPQKHGHDFMMTDIAKRWWRSLRNDASPGFLYVHYGGPHRPYFPPRRFVEEYTANLPVLSSNAGNFALDVHNRIWEYIADGCPFSDAEWATLKALYDGEIAHTDGFVGDLFDFVRAEGSDDTIFVVTSDHGELFGEHGLLAHQVVVDDALCHVPLVVHGFDEVVSHDGEHVQHADLMRTLLERLDGPTAGLQGVNLAEETREYSIVQRGGGRCCTNLEKIREYNPEFDVTRYHMSALTALRKDGFKFLQSTDRTELFQLPNESRDVSGEYPDVAASMEAELTDWLGTEGTSISSDQSDAAFTDAMRRQLTDLGYLD
jgi:uncharacterized sulfatase